MKKKMYKETIKFHFKAMKSIILNWFKKINKFDVNFRVMKPYTSQHPTDIQIFFFLKIRLRFYLILVI